MEIKKSPKADLENKKFLYREIGLIIALVVVFFAFEYKTTERAASAMQMEQAVILEEEMIPVTRETPPPPPEMPKEPTLSDFLDIVDDDIKIEHELVINTEDNRNVGFEIRDFVEGNTVVEEEIIEEEINYLIVEEKPKFQGGDENTFGAWVSSNIIYPDIATENGIQGRVVLSFIVDTDGRITDISVLRGVDPSVDKEAMRVVGLSPRWTPGRQRDKPVKVRYQFPVIFQLR